LSGTRTCTALQKRALATARREYSKVPSIVDFGKKEKKKEFSRLAQILKSAFYSDFLLKMDEGTDF
jgi:hypothetical protein